VLILLPPSARNGEAVVAWRIGEADASRRPAATRGIAAHAGDAGDPFKPAFLRALSRSSSPEGWTLTTYFEYSRNMVDIGVNRRDIRRMKIDDAAARLEALGNPTRLKIYRMLVRAGRAGMPVGRLQERLKIPASTLSHHVKALVAVGLISQVRDGTTLVCHAEYDTMQGLVDFLVAECCAEEKPCKATQTAA
jgi:DNA-binding transcriptional ArsR family regulator